MLQFRLSSLFAKSVNFAVITCKADEFNDLEIG